MSKNNNLYSLQCIEIDALRALNDGKKIQLEYNPARAEVKLLEVKIKKVKVQEAENEI